MISHLLNAAFKLTSGLLDLDPWPNLNGKLDISTAPTKATSREPAYSHALRWTSAFCIFYKLIL